MWIEFPIRSRLAVIHLDLTDNLETPANGQQGREG